MSTTKTYLVITRKDATTSEHVDVSDKPFAMSLWREGKTRDAMLDKIRDAHRQKGTGDTIHSAYTVDADADARKALDAINREINAARKADAIGGVQAAMQHRTAAAALESAWRASYPGFAAKYDALCDVPADPNNANAVARALHGKD